MKTDVHKIKVSSKSKVWRDNNTKTNSVDVKDKKQQDVGLFRCYYQGRPGAMVFSGCRPATEDVHRCHQCPHQECCAAGNYLWKVLGVSESCDTLRNFCQVANFLSDVVLIYVQNVQFHSVSVEKPAGLMENVEIWSIIRWLRGRSMRPGWHQFDFRGFPNMH